MRQTVKPPGVVERDRLARTGSGSPGWRPAPSARRRPSAPAKVSRYCAATSADMPAGDEVDDDGAAADLPHRQPVTARPRRPASGRRGARRRPVALGGHHAVAARSSRGRSPPGRLPHGEPVDVGGGQRPQPGRGRAGQASVNRSRRCRPDVRRRPARRPAVRSGAGRRRSTIDLGAAQPAQLRRVRATSTSRPARRMPTRSQTASTSASWCELRNTVCPRSRPRATQRRNSRSISGSRPLVGSSSTSSGARVANAATSATFCRLPVEYVPARLVEIQLEPLDQLVAVGQVDARARCRPAGPGSPRRSAAATAPRPPARRPGAGARGATSAASTPKIQARPRGGPEQAEQQPDRRGLAGAVRAEEPEHLARLRRSASRSSTARVVPNRLVRFSMRSAGRRQGRRHRASDRGGKSTADQASRRTGERR